MSDPRANLGAEVAQLRREFRLRELSEKRIDPDPIRQFLTWLDQAIQAEAADPNAMALATSGRDGAPSVRMVLLKGVSHEGFSFFTNYQSRKARELAQNPRAALVFYWPELERQVRVEGTVSRTSAEESDEYFASRPPEAQVGSAASPQSQPIASRQELIDRADALRQAHPDGRVPRPDHWGGYRVIPSRVEFWQGRPSRLHDRIEYIRDTKGEWSMRRLAP